jgi:hypothetical protein
VAARERAATAGRAARLELRRARSGHWPASGPGSSVDANLQPCTAR